MAGGAPLVPAPRSLPRVLCPFSPAPCSLTGRAGRQTLDVRPLPPVEGMTVTLARGEPLRVKSRNASVLDGARTRLDVWGIIAARAQDHRLPVAVLLQLLDGVAGVANFDWLAQADKPPRVGDLDRRRLALVALAADGSPHPIASVPALRQLLGRAASDAAQCRRGANGCACGFYLKGTLAPLLDLRTPGQEDDPPSQPTLRVALTLTVHVASSQLTQAATTTLRSAWILQTLIGAGLVGPEADGSPLFTPVAVAVRRAVAEARELAAAGVACDATGRWVVPCLRTSERAAAPPPAGIAVALRPHQRQALGAMLDRERAPLGINSVLYLPMVIKRRDFWYNVAADRFQKQPPPCVRSGLLASAMGLGKTVICIALMLAEPRAAPAGSNAPSPLPLPSAPSDAPCEDPRPGLPPPAGGTLVVCPVALVSQWLAEVAKVADGRLTAGCYHGRGRHKALAALTGTDVVVTTYSTLVSDAKRRGDPPLMGVHWHRVIFDESHHLKNKRSQQSRACAQLTADRRWCVTGTPVVTGTSDLGGQLDALGLPARWDACLERARLSQLGQVALLVFLKALAVRHEGDQRLAGQAVLALPPLIEHTVQLPFTPHERVAYDGLGGAVAERFHRVARDGGAGAVRRNTLALLAQLLPLRQACSGGPSPTLSDFVPRPGKSNGFAASTVVADKEQLDGMCAVCLDEFETPVQTRCGHVFCWPCIKVRSRLARAEGAARSGLTGAPFAM